MHIQIDPETEEDVKQLIQSSQKIVILDFFAEWCLPCRVTTQLLNQIDQKYNTYVDIIMVNVDASNTLAETYKIKAIPTLLFFKDNQLKHTKVGASTFRELQSLVESMI